ncbi:MAG TPA: methyltransferase domain-containing protein [Actinomycetota bacterium]|nr:methyltransferase domain-containing protein [Actinomycetota bacterium]
MNDRQRGLKRFVGGIYSSAAERFYEPMVVQGAFRLFGGELNQRIIELQTAAVSSVPGKAVLDMPTGTGYFTVELGGAYDGLVVAADIASGMVRESTAAAKEAGLDNVHCVQADVHRLPFPDGAFPIVFCWNGLQVMPGLDASVAELARVTAPGGRLLASTLHLPIGAALPSAASRHLPAALSSRRRMAEVFEAHGLRVISMTAERLSTIFDTLKPG